MSPGVCAATGEPPARSSATQHAQRNARRRSEGQKEAKKYLHFIRQVGSTVANIDKIILLNRKSKDISRKIQRSSDGGAADAAEETEDAGDIAGADATGEMEAPERAAAVGGKRETEEAEWVEGADAAGGNEDVGESEWAGGSGEVEESE